MFLTIIYMTRQMSNRLSFVATSLTDQAFMFDLEVHVRDKIVFELKAHARGIRDEPKPPSFSHIVLKLGACQSKSPESSG